MPVQPVDASSTERRRHSRVEINRFEDARARRHRLDMDDPLGRLRVRLPRVDDVTH